MNYLDKVKHRNEKDYETDIKEDETLSILGLTLNRRGLIAPPTNTNTHNVIVVYMFIALTGASIIDTRKFNSLIELLIIVPFAITALAPFILRKS